MKYVSLTESSSRKFSLNIAVRSLLFFVLYNLMGIVHSLICLIVSLMDRKEARNFTDAFVTDVSASLKELGVVK